MPISYTWLRAQFSHLSKVMRRAQLALLALLVMLLPLEALASKPAVREINARVFGGYVHDRTQSDTQVEGNMSSFLPTTTLSTWAIGGAITAPLYRRLGGRFLFSGGRDSSVRDSAPGFTGSVINADQIDATGMLFLRNPEFGHLGIGYQFRWEGYSGSSLERELTNAVLLDAGFYIPDLGIGPVDWNMFFSYGRVARRTSGATEPVNEFTVAGKVGYYLGPFWRFSAGIRWFESNPQFNETIRDLRGTVALSWLLPVTVAERRFATIRVWGDGGSVAKELSDPFSEADRGVYSVGCNLTFSYPGANSLIEMIREQY